MVALQVKRLADNDLKHTRNSCWKNGVHKIFSSLTFAVTLEEESEGKKAERKKADKDGKRQA